MDRFPKRSAFYEAPGPTPDAVKKASEKLEVGHTRRTDVVEIPVRDLDDIIEQLRLFEREGFADPLAAELADRLSSYHRG